MVVRMLDMRHTRGTEQTNLVVLDREEDETMASLLQQWLVLIAGDGQISNKFTTVRVVGSGDVLHLRLLGFLQLGEEGGFRR